MRFQFLNYVGEEFTPQEEAAWERLVAAAPKGEDILEHCKRVCSPGHCDLLPCPIGRYLEGPEK